MAHSFYGDTDADHAPIQEVILPFTTSARELALVEAYYRRMIVGQETPPPWWTGSWSRIGWASFSPSSCGSFR